MLKKKRIQQIISTFIFIYLFSYLFFAIGLQVVEEVTFDTPHMLMLPQHNFTTNKRFMQVNCEIFAINTCNTIFSRVSASLNS